MTCQLFHPSNNSRFSSLVTIQVSEKTKRKRVFLSSFSVSLLYLYFNHQLVNRHKSATLYALYNASTFFIRSQFLSLTNLLFSFIYTFYFSFMQQSSFIGRFTFLRSCVEISKILNLATFLPSLSLKCVTK